jgi:hypothetical protein
MCAAGSAASFEIDQLLQPLGGSPPRKKIICEGGHGPQLLLLISYFFFFPIVGSKAVWESERESRYENAARGCDAENPAPTARSTVPAPGARGHVIHVIRAREGGSRKAAPLPHPPRCKYVFCFLKRGDLQ